MRKKIKKEITRKYVDISLMIILFILVIIALKAPQRPVIGEAYVVETEHITAMVTVPGEIIANQEFITNIDLNVSGVSNGILVTAYIPEGLEVNSITPNNGMFVEDTIIWILEPEDYGLSFSTVGDVGEYDLKVKFGTYDNINEVSEENSSVVMFNITETPILEECVSTSDCFARFGETFECIEGYCVDICLGVDCGLGMNCINQGGSPMCVS